MEDCMSIRATLKKKSCILRLKTKYAQSSHMRGLLSLFWTHYTGRQHAPGWVSSSALLPSPNKTQTRTGSHKMKSKRKPSKDRSCAIGGKPVCACAHSQNQKGAGTVVHAYYPTLENPGLQSECRSRQAAH